MSSERELVQEGVLTSRATDAAAVADVVAAVEAVRPAAIARAVTRDACSFPSSLYATLGGEHLQPLPLLQDVLRAADDAWRASTGAAGFDVLEIRLSLPKGSL